MKHTLLAVNTAFISADIALQSGEQKFTQKIDSNSKHSEIVLKSIDQLLQQANLNIQEVETFAVVVGPGSFTGLRIGAAIAKALGCVCTEMKFLALSSLQLLAYSVVKQHKQTSDFACALDAHSSLAYFQEFNRFGEPISDEKLIALNEVKSFGKVVYTLDLDDFENQQISPEELLEFAQKAEKQGEFVKREEIVPKYLRLSQAEANLKKCEN